LQTFPNDLPRESVDFSSAAIRLVEGEKGIKLSEAQKARIIHDEQVSRGQDFFCIAWPLFLAKKSVLQDVNGKCGWSKPKMPLQILSEHVLLLF
jgi:hypothetical protein